MEADVAGPVRDLAWRAERALFNAWPSLEEVSVGDWTARFGGGLTRRNNSANPRRSSARLDGSDIVACEAAFDRWGLPRTFRLPTFLPPEVDQTLDLAGYALEGETVTLFRAIDGLHVEMDPRVRIEPSPTAAWLSAKAELSALQPHEAATLRDVVGRLAVPGGFVGLYEDGALTSLAYGAIDDELLCIEGVVTDPARRGRGLGRAMVAGLIAWGRDRGAKGVCLQVQADNTAALKLYGAIGLETELYRYHYRRAPAA